MKTIRKQATIKRSKLFLQLFILSLIFLLGISTVSADPGVIYVNNDTGDDSYDGQSSVFNGTSGPKLSIKNATGTVTDNGIVNIANGHYSGVGNTGIIIDRNMTINGENQTRTIINGSGTSQIFRIMVGVNVTIQNLGLTNGSAYAGGAINNSGNLTVINCTFTSNTASFMGGAIANDEANNGDVINFMVSGCTFTGNRAQFGGAIANGITSGSIISTVMDSTFTDNIATEGGGAIAIDCTDSSSNTVIGCTFMSNTAATFGGFYYNYRGTSEIHFNRIFGNTAPNGAAINSRFGSVNATDNWWGLNNPDFVTLVNGTVNYTPWLYMTFQADPLTITQGKTSQLTASFNNRFDGTTVTPFDPAIGHIPDGTPVTFTTNLGNVGSKSITVGTLSGMATTILRGDEAAGEALLSAILDNQTLTTNVRVNAATNNTNNTAHATGKISMQNTGVPVFGLILAFLMVLGGFAGTRKK